MYKVNITGALFERTPPTYFLKGEYLIAFAKNLIYICISESLKSFFVDIKLRLYICSAYERSKLLALGFTILLIRFIVQLLSNTLRRSFVKLAANAARF